MKSFSSKILLFGEHIVNKGAHALALPYADYYCRLSYDQNHPHFLEASKIILEKIVVHIESSVLLTSIYNLPKLKAEIEKGLIFHLNIPVGYGLGSSGAIVACIFEAFALKKDFNSQELKNILGETEGVFHGKSSGLDPLVSYLNQAIFIHEKTEIVNQKLSWSSHFEIFLLDTKQARKTGPLVEAFLTKAKKETSFASIIDQEIIPINNQIISNFLENKQEQSLALIQQLSGLQLQYFQDLILPQHLSIWQEGLSNNSYYLKICGAGGGGFMLGFTKNKAVELPFEVIWI